MQVKRSRINAIDMLRATMMLLGLVMHSGITYAVTNFGSAWPIKDPRNTTLLFDFLVGFIHTFRMPVFFIVSGFLACMLFVERGPQNMIVNRAQRIIMPFIAGLLLLYPAVIVAINYFSYTAIGKSGAFSAAVHRFYHRFALSHVSTVHLWFLYYLAIYCFLAWFVSLISQKAFPKLNTTITGLFGAIFRFKAAPAVFAIVTYLLLFRERVDFINTPFGFTIDINVFIIYACFFGFGWLLYHSRENLDRFKKGDWFFAAAGTILLLGQVTIIITNPGIEATSKVYLLTAVNALSVWFLAFGIIGLFLRFFNNYSALTRYISDASYWIYLIHLPLVVFFQGELIRVPLNPVAKFLIVISATLATALVSYNFFVRSSFIGKFLNGRKYPRGLPKVKDMPVTIMSV